jgi:methionyl aminopeptidase
MITKKSPEEIEVLKDAGHHLATILKTLANEVKPGVSTLDLDDRAMELSEEFGVEPVLLGYHPGFADRPLPGCYLHLSQQLRAAWNTDHRTGSSRR